MVQMSDQPLRAARRVSSLRAALVAGCLVGSAVLAAAGPFPERVDRLQQAADQYLAANPAPDARGYPAELRRVAWVFLAGDRLPDAVLVLKPRKDECAAVASSARPCRALVLRGSADGSFQVVTEFALLVHPVGLQVTAGGVRALYHSRDTGSAPAYTRYSFDGTAFVRDAGSFDDAHLLAQQVLMLDDRSLPLLADQQYAARQFANDAARLAPYRLHVDGIAISERMKSELVHDASFEERVKLLVDALSPDAARITAAIAWPQTLELRLWTCVDWMVPRRFWEVEDRRLGRVGVCADPAVFALRQGLARSNAEFVGLVRYRLLQEIGIAYLLRVAPLTQGLRLRLKTPQASPELLFMGAAAGLMLGSTLRVQTLEQAAEAHAALKRVSNRWFEEFEFKERRYVSKTPELRAFDDDLAITEQALACVRRGAVPAAKPVPACPKDLADRVESVRAALKESLEP